MVDAELLDTFQTEARELLRRAGVAAMQLEVARDADAAEAYRQLARDLHTLKGSSGTLDTPASVALSHQVHALETALKDAERDGALQAAATDVIDAIERWSAAVETIADAAPADASLGNEVPGMEGFFLFDEVEAERPQSRPPAASEPARAPNRPAEKVSVELLRIHPDRLDAAHRAAAELLVARLEGHAITQDMVALRDEARRLEQRLRDAQRSAAVGALATLRADAGALASGASQLAQRAVAHRDRSATWILSAEASIRRLRWMPVEPFLHELVPVVRHASRAVGKQVRFDVDGGGVEVDRQVLTGLRDGLLHMVRNAVVHGVEAPDDRVRARKDPVGAMWVRATSHGGRVRFEIGDDGRGVDVRAVIDKAVHRGLIGGDVTYDAATALRVLVTPGFSTASQVDDLAGRGVGMNVVYDQIVALGGQFTLDPGPGTGARFTIEVPIRASTTPALVVRVGDHRFGVPLRPIERVLRVSRGHFIGARHPTVDVEGVSVSVASAASELGVAATVAGGDSALGWVVHDGMKRLGLLVDDVLGELEMVIKPLPRAFSATRRYLGGAVQADGSVLAVLDVVAMVDEVAQRGSRGLNQAIPAPVPRVLVADRSPVLRALLVNLVRRAGCHAEPLAPDDDVVERLAGGGFVGAVLGSQAAVAEASGLAARSMRFLGVALDAGEEANVAAAGAPVWRMEQADAGQLSARLRDAGWFGGER